MFIKNIHFKNKDNTNINFYFDKNINIVNNEKDLLNVIKHSLCFIFKFDKKIGEEQSNFIANIASRLYSKNKQQITATISLNETTEINNGDINDSIKFWSYYKDLSDMPIMMLYPKSFPNDNKRIGSVIQDLLIFDTGLYKAQAYYNCWNPKDGMLLWKQYFTMQWMNHKFGHKYYDYLGYINAINDCLKKFTSSLSCKYNKIREVTLNTDYNLKEKLVLKFENGEEYEFEELPLNVRRVLSIVFDLSNRAYLLNENCNPDGVCFIEDIDKEFIGSLYYTFPRLQFIVTTTKEE